jgi:chorismate mutase
MSLEELEIIRSEIIEINRKIVTEIKYRSNKGQSSYNSINEKYDQIYSSLLSDLDLLSLNDNYTAQEKDKVIISLLEQRCEDLSIKIAETKKDLPNYQNSVCDQKRESELLKYIEEYATFYDLNTNHLVNFFKELFEISKNIQKNYLKEKYNIIIKD